QPRPRARGPRATNRTARARSRGVRGRAAGQVPRARTGLVDEAAGPRAHDARLDVAASDLVLGRGALRRSALLRVLEEECFVVLVLAGALAAVARLGPSLVVQDTWLALVDGRWIAAHGLPHVDGMAVWTKGTQWV